MRDWTKRQGYPVVRAEQLESGLLRLRQEHICSKEHAWWQLPLAVKHQDGTTATQLLEEPTTITLNGIYTDLDVGLSPGDWFLLNAGQTSFCRISYTLDHQRRLCSDIDRLIIGYCYRNPACC